MEATRDFSITEALKFGWDKTKGNFGKILLVSGASLVIILLLNFLSFFILSRSQDLILYILVNLAFFIILFWLSLGILKVYLKVADNQPISIRDLFSQTDKMWNYSLASLGYMLVCFFGFLLLFVPGIILAFKYILFPYFIVDRGMGPIEALKASGRATAGVKLKIFGFGVAANLVFVAGAFAFLLGIFVSIPVVAIATAYIYRKLASDVV